jgi:hypothetical protein
MVVLAVLLILFSVIVSALLRALFDYVCHVIMITKARVQHTLRTQYRINVDLDIGLTRLPSLHSYTATPFYRDARSVRLIDPCTNGMELAYIFLSEVEEHVGLEVKAMILEAVHRRLTVEVQNNNVVYSNVGSRSRLRIDLGGSTREGLRVLIRVRRTRVESWRRGS